MQKDTPRPFPGMILILGLAIILIGVLFFLLRPRPHAEAPKPAAAEEASRLPSSGYVNRSLWSNTPSVPGTLQQGVARPSISGNVYDMEGGPIAGATVVATTFELAGNIPSVAGSAKTDAAGRFEILLSEGTYQVNASREGYGPSSSTVRTGDVISLVLPVSGVVTGRVFDEKRQPVRRFTIDVISVVPGIMAAPAPVWTRTFDSPDGSFRADQLPHWSVYIKASAPGYATAFSQPLLVKPRQSRSIELTLPVGCTLSGTVKDVGGTPVPYVLVDAESRVLAGSGDASGQSANQVQTDAQGAFRIEHVPTGTVFVRAYDGAHAVSTTTVEVGSCDKLEPVKVVMGQGGVVEGVARTSDGKPIAGARMSLTMRATGIVATRTDEQGRFRFERIPAGNTRVELHHEGQRTLVNIRVKEGETIKQDVVLFARGNGEIRGRVRAGSRPLANVRMLIAAGHGEKGVDTYYAVTGKDGTFVLKRVPEGLYLVSAVSTSKGQGVKVEPGAVVNVDLDITPKEEPPEPEDDEEDVKESQPLTPAAASLPASVPPAGAPPAAPSAIAPR